MKSAFVFILVMLSLFILFGCPGPKESLETPGAAPQTAAKPASGPSPRDLDGLDARAAMTLANRWGTAKTDVKSFVTPQEVSFTFANGKKVRVPLSPDKMVVALAPYVSKTHPCEVHYMSGCQGELTGLPVKVLAKKSDGAVILEDTVTTLPNGFIELWLPRDLEINLSLEALGRKTEGMINTYSDSYTCVTTFQLQ